MISLDHDTQWKALDNYLKTFGRKIMPVPRDGFCILASVQVLLSKTGVVVSIGTLIDALKEEMASEFWLEFTDAESKPAVKQQIEQFVQDPSKHYVADDFVLPALSRKYQMKSVVYNIDEYGSISTMPAGPQRGGL